MGKDSAIQQRAVNLRPPLLLCSAAAAAAAATCSHDPSCSANCSLLAQFEKGTGMTY